MSKTWSVTKYLTNIYICVIFYVTLFCYTIRNMAIFLIFWNMGWTLKINYFFLLFPTIFLKEFTINSLQICFFVLIKKFHGSKVMTMSVFQYSEIWRGFGSQPLRLKTKTFSTIFLFHYGLPLCKISFNLEIKWQKFPN